MLELVWSRCDGLSDALWLPMSTASALFGARKRKEISQVMSRVKVSLMALVAVLAFSAMVAGSASAEWFVAGTKLPAGSKAALTNTAKVDSDAKLNIPAAGIKILCSGSTLDGEAAEIIGANEGKAKSLIFTGCAVTEPATGCTLEESTIKTLAVTATVTKGTGEADIATFTPQTKNTFAEIPFSGTNTCAFNEKEPAKGAVKVNAPTGQLELLSQIIEGLGSIENNSLEVAKDKSFIEGGKALLTLASDSKWSFH